MSSFRFDKSRRISSKRDIEFLFSGGKPFMFFPFRVIIAEKADLDFPLKMLVSVPKSKMRKAVSRNRIKRLTREAWRLNSAETIGTIRNNEKFFLVGLIYVQDVLTDYSTVEKAVRKILKHISVFAEEKSKKD